MNEGRGRIIQFVFVLIGITFLIKLFFIQVADSRYADMANSNAILRKIDYPVRGLIKDRNGKLLVFNTPEFDLQVVYREIEDFDSSRFCKVFSLTQEELRQEWRFRRETRAHHPSANSTQVRR